MDFEEYQKLAKKTSLNVKIDSSFVYPTLGLVSEAGEIAGKVKKIYRDNNGILDQERKETLEKEIGDVLWYIAELCTELNISLDDVATLNIKRLASRQQRNTLHGDGDNR